MTMARKVFLVTMLLALAATMQWMRSTPAAAQLVTVNEEYTVTELRQDKNKIGVSAGRSRGTRNWIKVNGDTRVAKRVWVTRHSYRDEVLTHSQMWKMLRPGTRIKVAGGRDWDQTVVAKKIWL
jgi:hypothetical protein